METKFIKIDRNDPDLKVIQSAGEILRKGGLVAFPTETVYGLGADALSPQGARKIYAAKGRPSDNPLIVHISCREDLEQIAQEIPPETELLFRRFCPGPLTMIFRKRTCVPLETTGGLDTVAVRFPSDPVAQELIRAGGGFICAPSANRSGRPSPTTGRDVLEDLDGKIDMILDGGTAQIGLESTIIDLSVPTPVILRPGAITREMLREVLPKLAKETEVRELCAGEAPKAPGMKYRHYAPRAEMLIIEGEREQVVREILCLVEEARKAGKRPGILASQETMKVYEKEKVVVKCPGSSRDVAVLAKNLYGKLREFDREPVDIIYSEMFGGEGLAEAVKNRLVKAAGNQVRCCQVKKEKKEEE